MHQANDNGHPGRPVTSRIDRSADEPRVGRLVMERVRLDLVAEAKRAIRDEYLAKNRPAGSRTDYEAVALSRDCLHAAMYLIVHLAHAERQDVLERLILLGRNAELPGDDGVDPRVVGEAVAAALGRSTPARELDRTESP